MEKGLYVMLGFAAFTLIIIILVPIISCIESTWKRREEKLSLLRLEDEEMIQP